MKALALAALLGAGAPWASPVRAAVPERTSGSQEWDEYRIRTRKDLDVVADRIADLETAAKPAEAAARERLQTQVNALRAEKDEADRLLDKFEAATEDERQELRIKLDRALLEIGKALQDAETKPRRPR